MARSRPLVPRRIVAAAVAAAIVTSLGAVAGAARAGGAGGGQGSSLGPTVLQRRDVASSFGETARPLNPLQVTQESAADTRGLGIVEGYDAQFRRPRGDATNMTYLNKVFEIESQAILFRTTTMADGLLRYHGTACAFLGEQTFKAPLGSGAVACGGPALIGSTVYVYWREGRLVLWVSVSSTDANPTCRLQQLAVTFAEKQQTDILRSRMLPTGSKRPHANVQPTCTIGRPRA